MATYLITGSSRGLGLTLATILAARPASEVKLVIATGRSKSKALDELITKHPGRVEFVPLEVGDANSVKKAAVEVEKLVGEGGLDVLINNAGVMSKFEGVAAMDDLMSTLEVNVQGPQLVISSFLPLLRKGERKLVASISTAMGSIALAPNYGFALSSAYKISKAALNMLIAQYALELGKDGLTFILISPGWLQTDMGTGYADLPVQTGANATLEVVDRAKHEDNGKFFDIKVEGWDAKGGPNVYRGEELPW